jgi:hypothetical protein
MKTYFFIALAGLILVRHDGHHCHANEAAGFSGLGDPRSRGTDMTVFVNTSKQVGDKDHIKVFANQDAAETWFAENDPEGVAFEYEVLE